MSCSTGVRYVSAMLAVEGGRQGQLPRNCFGTAARVLSSRSDREARARLQRREELEGTRGALRAEQMRETVAPDAARSAAPAGGLRPFLVQSQRN